MADNIDPIVADFKPQRVAYAIGRMLGAEDFQAEQNYHRNRLARVARVLGTGTVYGLNVSCKTDPNADNIEVRVEPGMAIDRAGRLIEVLGAVCIRLKKFLDAQSDSDLSLSFKDTGDEAMKLVADVFVRFVQCDRGKTPAFADNDYDATDAFTANRTLDGFRMELVLRKDNAKLPVDPWEKVVAKGTVTAATVNSVKTILLSGKGIGMAEPQEYPEGYDDPTAVFLARIGVAGKSTGAGKRPSLDYSKIDVNNMARLFVYPPSLLARGIGLLAVNP
jgi:hypothetical protein